MSDQAFNTAICCIAKCENHYLKEWVDYHLGIGFKDIFIYDNNAIDGERIEPLFEGYEHVTILDCRGKIMYQRPAYTDFYHRYGAVYDWIAYIDVDEFITFSESSGIHTIDEFLHTFDKKEVDVIQLNWMLYGDNDIVCSDSFSVLDRFVNPLPYDIKLFGGDYPQNDMVKNIYRGGLLKENQMNTPASDWSVDPHGINGLRGLSYADDKGERCEGSWHKPYDFSVAYVRHYFTKTIVEWIIKKSRGRVNGNPTQWAEKYSFDTFFDVNARTEEKERIIRCFEIFSEMLSTSESNNLAFMKSFSERWDSINKQNDAIWQRYIDISNSKEYRLGRFLLRPVSLVKSKLKRKKR
jgi:hypothetical protein